MIYDYKNIMRITICNQKKKDNKYARKWYIRILAEAPMHEQPLRIIIKGYDNWDGEREHLKTFIKFNKQLYGKTGRVH